MEVEMNNDRDEEYKQEVMLTCKILLDSLKEGKHVDLTDLVGSRKKKVQFVAKVIKFGDTFRSDSTQPIYGLLFTTEGDDYLLKKLDEFGIGENTRVRITVQSLEERSDG